MASERQNKAEPFIRRLELVGLDAIELPAGALVFVVGPNNGGKSTFLNDIHAVVGRATGAKWIQRVEWDLGTEAEYLAYVADYFAEKSDIYLTDIRTGNQVGRQDILQFYTSQRTHHSSFLIRFLNAQSRIDLANPTQSPDVLNRIQLHPYHGFFYDTKLETAFSKKVKAAFGRDLRVNRTGNQVVGHLGKAPTGNRLSTDYEAEILGSMIPIDQFGDGVRSYTGILLNAVADIRPVTIIDEPEAFLHPPQARRLGQEIALAAKGGTQQVFVATHSADFIQGALAAKNSNTVFLYLDHSNIKRPLLSIDKETVEEFSKKPLLVHTNALDALFYDQAIVCEGEADIMFFKWALEGTPVGKKADDTFWMSAYGKSAIPGIMQDLAKLGVASRCVFDLDVLLSLDILEKVCTLVEVDFSPHYKALKAMASAIKVPPAAKALQEISQIVDRLDATDDELSRLEAIRAVKRSAESLGKSWTLKTAGLAALPKGQTYAAIVAFIELMKTKGVLILKEGEIENYLPEIGGHGQGWVRAALEQGVLSDVSRTSIKEQFAAIL